MIIDVIPEVELIIGQQPAVPTLGAAETQNRFNLVLQKFISVFTSKEHPLVLFLDDLQWADSATFTLIKLLMCEQDSQYLLLIGAYRDNEVDLTHPLIQTVDEIQKAGIGINRIYLRSLNLTDVNQLISHTLRCNTERTRPLAKLIYNKTHGNPFFLTQLLKTIYQEKLLSYDIGAGDWQWDISLINEMGITDNVVELMVGKIQKLNNNTQQILKLAACIGNQFNLEVLSVVNEKSLSATASELWEALQVGIILPLSDAYKIPMLVSSLVSPSEKSDCPNETLTIEYKFLHDGVQQATYSLISADRKKEVHLKVGQMLLKNTSLLELKDKIFDIVNHLNIRRELISQQSAFPPGRAWESAFPGRAWERDELARLNLIAGQKAKAATAYGSSVNYLTVGLELLASDSWEKTYELTLALYQETVEAEYLNTNFARSIVLADVAIQQVTTILDRVALY